MACFEMLCKWRGLGMHDVQEADDKQEQRSIAPSNIAALEFGVVSMDGSKKAWI